MQYKMNYVREQAPPIRPPGVKQQPFKTRGHALPEGHFDPDELCRRLYLVLAEQRAHAERRRTRAEAAAAAAAAAASAPKSQDSTDNNATKPSKPLHKTRTNPEHTHDLITDLRRSRSSAKRRSTDGSPPATAGEYHHVPKEAAKQFARTTTVENMRTSDEGVHQLSLRALKFHKDGTNRGAEHDKALNRNQFQRTRMLEDAAHRDDELLRTTTHTHTHTFEGELARLMPEGHHLHHHRRSDGHARRNSTGNAIADAAAAAALALDKGDEHNRRSLMMMDPLLDAAEDVTPPEELRHYPAHEHRVDWTQSDETAGGRARPKLLLTPLLKKADSIWALRGRIGSGSGSKGSSASSSVPAVVAESATSPGKGEGAAAGSQEALKSPKVGFFAKFKR
ncbi:hypothetical protein B0T22DRAFT_261238 [Podospora appendiculata]|uniref:Uncharacterized protein n=1 Tax=Podospora appendiculata TaxID=314037 RepID=A0AAE1C985_9PEZI|nr:hypothetical protein B0T22DRAFT_261238 [Podospora appendiculata]